MAKHHFVPRLIIKSFSDSDEKISFYSKKNNSVSKPIPYYNQLQEGNFYSKKSLFELKETFDYITINPLFKDLEKTLEENLSRYIELPMGAILSKIVPPILNEEYPILLPEETDFIKEYITIQHIRNARFKMIGNEIHTVYLKLPPNIGDIVKKIENNRQINPVELINNKFSYLNSKGRRAKVKELKKLLENPDFLKRIRESAEINSALDEEIKKVEEKLERIRNSPDKHSSEVIDSSLGDNFLKKRGLDKNNIRFVLNNTSIPFVLTDTGLVIMCLDYGDKKELRIYLPIHPKILIELSPEKSLFLSDEEYVKEFNKISKDESVMNVYSNSAEALKLLIE